jgi:hypothetical protein
VAKETLLDSDIGAGERFVQALDKSGKRINAALWLYYPDVSQWKLLLGSPDFDQDLTGSYTWVSQVLSGEDDVNKNISIGDVKILNPKDPLMHLLKSIVHEESGKVRMTSNVLGGIYVEDALIYRSA